MKETVRIAFFIVIGALALLAQGPRLDGPGGPFHGGPGGAELVGHLLHGAPVTGAPFSAVATTQEQQSLSDGNQISKETQTKIYRDSEGRIRTETSFTTP